MPSLLDDGLEVTENTWIVSLLRQPEGEIPQHAFIVVEGSTTHGRTLLRRYDLFLEKKEKEAAKTYKIEIIEKDVAQILAARTLLNDVLNNQMVLAKIWQFSCEKAEQLHALVKEAQTDLNRSYNILGDTATLPKIMPDSEKKTVQAISSNRTSALIAEGIFSPSGHNCFTWARTMLRQLNLKHITDDLPTNVEEIIGSVTSRLMDSTSGIRLKTMGMETQSPKPSCTLL